MQKNDYVEIGSGIKEGMKGLNTVASPKKKKTCITFSSIPFWGLLIMFIGVATNLDIIIALALIPLWMSGFCNFYVGNFKKGIIYTFTFGLFFIGLLSDLFRLKVTGTFKDSNGFPVIY